MRFLPFLLILTMVACGPSAQQMTATADAASAQTQTAAPTFTPTLTLTPTMTPTLAASATPSIPKVQGRLQMNFVGLDSNTIIPKPPFGLTLKLTTGDTQIAVEASPEDGSFTTYLEPGTYTISSVSIKNAEFGTEVSELVAYGAQIEIPSQPCYYAGAIMMTAIRLPPGSVDEQLAVVQQLELVGEMQFLFFETGGVLMPVLTESAGAGTCANLPASPEGFQWKYLPESSVAVLAPEQWHFRSEQSETARGYFISLENISTEGSFMTGLTVNVQRDESRNAMQVAEDLPLKILDLAGIVPPVEVSTRTDGNMTFYEFEYQTAGSRAIIVHNLIAANQATNTLYVITFESPAEHWEEAWKTGQVMIEQLVFLDNE
ncbi:MAG TPA: hypothetical protein VFQ23_15865 [Anaerolineales bacterium]|nr:hypothetical protein [Anaerolineales bacterium]